MKRFAPRVLLLVALLAGGVWIVNQSFAGYVSQRGLSRAAERLRWADLGGALDYLEDASRNVSGDSRLHLEIGTVLLMQSKWWNDPDAGKQAVESMALATRLNPLDAEGFASLAGALTQLGSHFEAARVMRQALVRDPQNIYYLVTLASILERDGEGEAAESAYERALEIASSGEVRRLVIELRGE